MTFYVVMDVEEITESHDSTADDFMVCDESQHKYTAKNSSTKRDITPRLGYLTKL